MNRIEGVINVPIHIYFSKRDKKIFVGIVSLQHQTHFFEHLAVMNIFGAHKKHQNPGKAYLKGKSYHPKTLILAFSKKILPLLNAGQLMAFSCVFLHFF